MLGKELRRDRQRALRELRARSAAAAVLLRQGAGAVVALEAPLRGQTEAGSALVGRFLGQLGVPSERMVLGQVTRSTREEAREYLALARQRGWRRLVVLTAAYHLPRVRRYFDEACPPGVYIAVHTPEAFCQEAAPEELGWIRAGVPDEQAMADEAGVERLFSGLTLALRPLPRRLRWELEIQAAALLRLT